jgi:hypothetical protein
MTIRVACRLKSLSEYPFGVQHFLGRHGTTLNGQIKPNGKGNCRHNAFSAKGKTVLDNQIPDKMGNRRTRKLSNR